MITKTCGHPRCFEPLPCPNHKPTPKDTKTESERRFYNSAAWRNARNRHIQKEPLCRDHQARGLIVAGYVVDHIQALRDGGPALDPSNLQTLCEACHNEKRRKEQLTRRGYVCR